jgi:hypothetical protein
VNFNHIMFGIACAVGIAWLCFAAAYVVRWIQFRRDSRAIYEAGGGDAARDALLAEPAGASSGSGND